MDKELRATYVRRFGKILEVSLQICRKVSPSKSDLRPIGDLQVVPNIIKYEPTACMIRVSWRRAHELKKRVPSGRATMSALFIYFSGRDERDV